MNSRPSIPTDIQRALFIECGHRCAVCCTAFPLEQAHIIPWKKTKDHSIENLICLCANCHERADKDWDSKTLRKYKENPCVKRYTIPVYSAEETALVEISIKMDIKNFNDQYKGLVLYALSGFLGIPPTDIKIEKITEGSVKIEITVPKHCEKQFNTAIDGDFKNLKDFFLPLELNEVKMKNEPLLVESEEKHSNQPSKIDHNIYTKSNDVKNIQTIEKEKPYSTNVHVDYDGGNYLRILKYFKPKNISNICDHQIAETWETDGQNEFYLRCYLPKSQIISKDKKDRIEHLVIMINGFDEIFNYNLYDLLGEDFANRGMASILLPTPYHLNRRVINTSLSEQKNKSIYYLPSNYFVKENSMMHYYNNEKSISELEDLLTSILSPNREDLGFYESYFSSKSLKISLVGYSLGGLTAYSSFFVLKNNFTQIKSCILWNTNLGLENILKRHLGLNFDFLQETIESVNNGINYLIENDSRSLELAKIFQWLYFTCKEEQTKESKRETFELLRRFEKVSRNCLLIQSDTDKVENYASDLFKNTLIVSRTDHLPRKDNEWMERFTIIFAKINDFIQESKSEVYNKFKIEDEIFGLIKNTNFFKEITVFNRDEYEKFDDRSFMALKWELINESTENSEGNTNKFVELYYISKAFYPSFSELLNRLIHKKSVTR